MSGANPSVAVLGDTQLTHSGLPFLRDLRRGWQLGGGSEAGRTTVMSCEGVWDRENLRRAVEEGNSTDQDLIYCSLCM